MLGLSLAAAGAVLAGCQPAAGAAAYVGDHRISDQQLQDDVANEQSDPQIKQDIASQLGGDLSQLRRQLLNELVLHELVGEAQDRERLSVSDAEVGQLIEADGGYAQIAQSTHLSKDLITRRYKDLLLIAELGYTKQGVPRPTEASLRQQYEQAAPQRASVSLGLIMVKDEATLNQVYNQVRATPDKFEDISKSYPGSNPKPTEHPRSDLPPVIANAKAGDVVRYVGVGGDAGTFYVVKIFSVTTPTFEEMRTQLLLPSVSTALQAGVAYVGKLSQEIGVRISPRYGTWDPKQAQITDTKNPVVTLVNQPSTPAAPAGNNS
jgi:SurA-like protein